MSVVRAQLTEAYLGDIVGSVPDQCNKVNIAIKWVTWIFWFPSACNSYVYAIVQFIKCAMALCLEKQCTYLNVKKCFITKTADHHLSLQKSESFCWWTVLPPCWWLLTDQGGGYWRLGWPWQFLKIKQKWSLPRWLTFPSTSDFSVVCNAV